MEENRRALAGVEVKALGGSEIHRAAKTRVQEFALRLFRVWFLAFGLDGQSPAGVRAQGGMRRPLARPRIDFVQACGEGIVFVSRDADGQRLP